MPLSFGLLGDDCEWEEKHCVASLDEVTFVLSKNTLHLPSPCSQSPSGSLKPEGCTWTYSDAFSTPVLSHGSQPGEAWLFLLFHFCSKRIEVWKFFFYILMLRRNQPFRNVCALSFYSSITILHNASFLEYNSERAFIIKIFGALYIFLPCIQLKTRYV